MPHFMSISLNTMSLSLPFSFCSLNRSLRSHRSIPKHPLVRSQFRDDQGKSANIVDANLSILTERIEELRTKESLNKCVMAKNNIGWNYQYNYEHNKTKSKDCLFAAESLKFLGFTSGVLGLVFLGGTLCICFVSLLVQLTK